jgi:uncharacterized small protein (DUF1192 family)
MTLIIAQQLAKTLIKGFISGTILDMKDKDGDAKARIRELEATCNKYTSEIARLQFRAGELQAEVTRLKAELSQRRGVRRRASDLYHAVDDAIIHRIDSRGYQRKQRKLKGVSHAIKLSKLEGADKSVLMQAAREYDVHAYFRLRSPKIAMRLQYLLLSKGYRIVRDVSLFGLKKTYKAARRVAR